MKKRFSGSSIVWGLILVGLGVGFLFGNAGFINFESYFSSYWPIILLIVALGEFISQKYTAALIWTVLGLILLGNTTKAFEANVWDIIWPLLIILIGIRIFLRANRPEYEEGKGDSATATGIFSGDSKRYDSKDFKSATMNSVFGGTKLDLSNVKLSKDGAVIDVLVIFGGAELIVPKNTPVDLNTLNLFGGTEDKRREKSDGSGPKIRVKGTILFGGFEIKD